MDRPSLCPRRPAALAAKVMREDAEPIQVGANARSLEAGDPRLHPPPLSPKSALFEPPGQSGLPWRFCSLVMTRTRAEKAR